MKRVLAAGATFALALILTGCTFTLGGAVPEPAAPPLERPIVDTTDTLTVTETDRIADVINAGREQSGRQTAVLVIDSLGGEAIETYSLRMARDWGVGDAELNNGVLLVVAVDDHELRIEVGTGLEGDLPDAVARRIGDDIMVPYMKDDNLYDAVLAGAEAVQADGDRLITPRQDLNSNSVGDFLIPIAFLIGFAALWIYLGRLEKRKKAEWLAAHGNMEGYVPTVTTSTGRGRSRSGGGGGGRSSGNSSRMGGGGFSGGGSSSRW